MHWVSAPHAVEAEVRLYGHLFARPDPSDFPPGQDWKVNLNPNSELVMKDARLEPSLAGVSPGQKFQFERLGYFCVDKDTTAQRPVFNRTVSLKDSWAKEQKKK
jgi:glutaminyl-tRNA synthetase